MSAIGGEVQVGQLLRGWRERRRMTQLELALEAGISTRHLSFVETGRSSPGRDTLLSLAEELDIPFRERNQLLLAAGHAPAFPQRELSDPVLEPVREALDRILAAHDPYPAIVFDREWNLVATNSAMRSLFAEVDVDEALLTPPVNLLRLTFHPRGLGSLVFNLGAWRRHFLDRLEHQITATGDPQLRELAGEVAGYPLPDDAAGGEVGADPSAMLGPVRVRAPGGGEWSFFGMFAGFDTPFEVTTSELALELLFPADRATFEALKKGAT